MATVIVATGGTSGTPEFAGSTWVRMQYVLGFQRLGLRSVWLDHLPDMDAASAPHSFEYLARRFAWTAEEFGFSGRSCIVDERGIPLAGLDAGALRDVIDDAALVISIGATLPRGSPLERVPRRAYVDVDPGFTQIWARQSDMGLERYSAFFTVGQSVGSETFAIPTSLPWAPIVPPVVLDEWPVAVDEHWTRYSTIADWRGSQEAIFEGVYYGGKREEFVRLLRVPVDAGRRVELALCIGQHDYEDLGLLLGHGWRVRDASRFAGDPHSYREFIQRSRAELGVAKSGYVRSRSGWVSDRTGCYLASGKPALVQSTGFESSLPTGKGLLSFRTAAEAVAGIEAIESDYEAHSVAARRIAEERFDSDRVLGNILEQVGL